MRFLSAALLLALPLALAALNPPPAHSEDASPALQVRPAATGTREPSHIAFTPNGSRAVLPEPPERTLSLIHVAAGKLLNHLPTQGREPRGVAVTPDGSL